MTLQIVHTLLLHQSQILLQKSAKKFFKREHLIRLEIILNHFEKDIDGGEHTITNSFVDTNLDSIVYDTQFSDDYASVLPPEYIQFMSEYRDKKTNEVMKSMFNREIRREETDSDEIIKRKVMASIEKLITNNGK